MTAYDIFEDEVEMLRKRGTPEHELYNQVHQQNPGLYQRYVAERQAGIRSAREVKADAGAEALRKSLERPPVPTEPGPCQAIALEMSQSHLDSGRCQTYLEAMELVRQQYPQLLKMASDEAWRQAAGRH